MSPDDVINWIDSRKKRFNLEVRRIPFASSREWRFTPENYSLVHNTGRFFSIKGYRAATTSGETFCQPLIHQWEIGIQAFLVRGCGKNLEILLQAKTEPGNIGTTQVSPTLQVTRSNLQAVHQGKTPNFAEIFQNLSGKILLNKKYPELGNRYYQKYNENIIIEKDVTCDDDSFKWIPVATFKRLLQLDNVVNNDARLVASLLFLEYGNTFLGSEGPFHKDLLKSWEAEQGASFATPQDAIKWLRSQRTQNFLQVKEVPLSSLDNWEITEDSISQKDGTNYSIVQISVDSDEREVSRWDQPIVTTHQRGLVGLLCKKLSGVLHVLFEASPQIGNHQGIELLPSVCYDGQQQTGIKNSLLQTLLEATETIGECLYSEEGGRFLEDESFAKIAVVSDLPKLPENYCWLTLGQIRQLCGNTHFFSDEARSILGVLLSFL